MSIDVNTVNLGDPQPEIPSLEVSFTDWRGNTIRVGSTVLYPGEYISSCRMVEGVVKKIVVRANFKGDPEYKVQVQPKRKSRETGFDRLYPRYLPPVTITYWQNLTAVV